MTHLVNDTGLCNISLWQQILQDETILCFVCVLFGSQVKEKETARKEYKKAIEKGHGAYLMDQDAPVCPPSVLSQILFQMLLQLTE